MAAYIVGGHIPYDPEIPKASIQKDLAEQQRLAQMAPQLACSEKDPNTSNNNWFVHPDSIQSAQMPLSPCGETLKGMEAKLYPNPTSDFLHIQLSGLKEKIGIEIFSSTGVLILSQKIDEIEGTDPLSFNVSGLSSGTYWVQISHRKYQKTLRFIKI